MKISSKLNNALHPRHQFLKKSDETYQRQKNIFGNTAEGMDYILIRHQHGHNKQPKRI